MDNNKDSSRQLAQSSPSLDRQELGAFLRAKRTQLEPASLGLTTATRRRSAGLRREEVAQLAAVGLTWYTWLEQGRNIHVSAQVLKGISRALQLNAREQAYMFQLAQVFLANADPTLASAVSPQLKFLTDALQIPAYIINQRWDILAANELLRAMDSWQDSEITPTNMLEYLLFDPDYHNNFINWEDTVRNTVALFRATASSAIGTPWLQEFTTTLDAQSPLFRTYWPQQNVAASHSKPPDFISPKIGKLSLDIQFLRFENEPKLWLVTRIPLDQHTTNRLAELLKVAPKTT
jgi:transcriptional regulator with XRE-family HTH domain